MKLLRTICSIYITFILIFLYSMYIGTTNIKINEYNVANTKITIDNHGLKIVHISDIHYNSKIKEKEMEELVEKINLTKPDIVVFTGDLLKTNDNTESLILSLQNINADFGKYYITGNNDNDETNEILKKANFTNLNNDFKIIYTSQIPIIISGIPTYNHQYNITQSFDNYITENNENLYSILITHEPDIIANININNYDLILAGHSLHGQIKLPITNSIYTPLGAKIYKEGYYKINNTDFYISNGIGNPDLDIRLFNKPSFNLYRLTQK